jgi:hypothetical protein
MQPKNVVFSLAILTSLNILKYENIYPFWDQLPKKYWI